MERKLIAEVSQRPALFDAANRDYHNRVKIEEEWSEIADAVGADVYECRKKWKYLRDRFRLELKKGYNIGPGDLLKYRSRWQHFKSLDFLKYHMNLDKKKASASDDLPQIADPLQGTRYKEETDCEFDEDFADEEIPSEDNEHEQDNDHEEENNLLRPINAKKRKMKDSNDIFDVDDDSNDNDIPVEKPTTSSDSNVLQNSDLLFFKSLLDFMKEFTPIQRLRVRDKMQKIVLDELSRRPN